MHATKAAVEEDMISGGGALLRAKAAIGKPTNENADAQSGVNIVLQALESANSANRREWWRGGVVGKTQPSCGVIHKAEIAARVGAKPNVD
jgi:hypothetical protein